MCVACVCGCGLWAVGCGLCVCNRSCRCGVCVHALRLGVCACSRVCVRAWCVLAVAPTVHTGDVITHFPRVGACLCGSTRRCAAHEDPVRGGRLHVGALQRAPPRRPRCRAPPAHGHVGRLCPREAAATAQAGGRCTPMGPRAARGRPRTSPRPRRRSTAAGQRAGGARPAGHAPHRTRRSRGGGVGSLQLPHQHRRPHGWRWRRR